MVRSTISKVEDLKGKTVAVAAPGSLPNLLINAILEKYKIPQSDVRFANLGGDLERYKAVVAGIADAGVVAAEFMSIAPKDITMLVDGRDVLPNYVRVCLTVTGKTLADRRARGRSVLSRRKWMRCASRSAIATRPSSSRKKSSTPSPTIRGRLMPMTTPSSTA